jgi:hypothetical protein
MKNTPRHPLNPDRLAKIPIEAVSTIAAKIRSDSPHESIRKAYELLDIAASAQAFLERNDQQSFEAGIDHHHTITEQKREFEKNRLAVSFNVDSEGNRQNVPFETLVKSLKTGKTLEDRVSRLKLFIGSLEGIEDPIKKADRVDHLMREGVPPNLANAIVLCFHAWWKASVSGDRSDAGTKGGNTPKKRKPKSKQGQVKSKEDKRIGSKTSLEDAYANLPPDDI